MFIFSLEDEPNAIPFHLLKDRTYQRRERVIPWLGLETIRNILTHYVRSL